MKRLVILVVLCFFFASSFAQYATNRYMYKPEPVINVPKDKEINASIFSQTKEMDLNPTEKELLYWMDFARKHPRLFYDSVVCRYINTYSELAKPEQNNKSLREDLYFSEPLPLLVIDKKLTAFAKKHAADVWRNNNPEIAHKSSYGQSFQERAEEFGLHNICLGENLGFGSGSVLMQLVLLYLDVGHLDLGHRKNLLTPSFTNIGVAVVQLKDGELFFVQDFSCQPGADN